MFFNKIVQITDPVLQFLKMYLTQNCRIKILKALEFKPNLTNMALTPYTQLLAGPLLSSLFTSTLKCNSYLMVYDFLPMESTRTFHLEILKDVCSMIISQLMRTPNYNFFSYEVYAASIAEVSFNFKHHIIKKMGCIQME